MTKEERDAIRQLGGTPRRGRPHKSWQFYTPGILFSAKLKGEHLRALLKYKTTDGDTWADMMDRLLIDLQSREETVECKTLSYFDPM